MHKASIFVSLITCFAESLICHERFCKAVNALNFKSIMPPINKRYSIYNELMMGQIVICVTNQGAWTMITLCYLINHAEAMVRTCFTDIVLTLSNIRICICETFFGDKKLFYIRFPNSDLHIFWSLNLFLINDLSPPSIVNLHCARLTRFLSYLVPRDY
jgi:hypothetical protein